MAETVRIEIPRPDTSDVLAKLQLIGDLMRVLAIQMRDTSKSLREYRELLEMAQEAQKQTSLLKRLWEGLKKSITLDEKGIRKSGLTLLALSKATRQIADLGRTLNAMNRLVGQIPTLVTDAFMAGFSPFITEMMRGIAGMMRSAVTTFIQVGKGVSESLIAYAPYIGMAIGFLEVLVAVYRAVKAIQTTLSVIMKFIMPIARPILNILRRRVAAPIMERIAEWRRQREIMRKGIQEAMTIGRGATIPRAPRIRYPIENIGRFIGREFSEEYAEKARAQLSILGRIHNRLVSIAAVITGVLGRGLEAVRNALGRLWRNILMKIGVPVYGFFKKLIMIGLRQILLQKALFLMGRVWDTLKTVGTAVAGAVGGAVAGGARGIVNRVATAISTPIGQAVSYVLAAVLGTQIGEWISEQFILMRPYTEALRETRDALIYFAEQANKSGEGVKATMLGLSAVATDVMYQAHRLGEEFRDWATTNIPIIGGAIGTLGEWILKAGSLFAYGLQAIIFEKLAGPLQSIADWLSGIGERIRGGFDWAIRELRGGAQWLANQIMTAFSFLGNIGEALRGAFTGFITNIENLGAQVLDSLQGAIDSVAQFLGTAGQKFIDAVTGLGEKIWRQIVDAINYIKTQILNVFSGITTPVSGVVDWLTNALGGAAEAVHEFTLAVERGNPMPPRDAIHQLVVGLEQLVYAVQYTTAALMETRIAGIAAEDESERIVRAIEESSYRIAEALRNTAININIETGTGRRRRLTSTIGETLYIDIYGV